MRRETQNVLLVLLGGALVTIAADGSYLRYVKPWAQPGLFCAGAVIVGLALVAIVADLRRGPSPRPGSADPAQAHHAPGSAWLLLLPVLAIFLVAPPALGADSVRRAGDRSAVSSGHPAAFPPLPAAGVPAVGIADFVSRALWDPAGSLIGRQVRLTGFVVRSGAEVDLARLVITCCAADAEPVRIRLAGLDGAGWGSYRQDSWLEVRGMLVPGTASAANGYVPTVTVTGLRPVAAPEDSYEY